MDKMESFGHTCTHIDIPKPATDAIKKCAFDMILITSPLLNIGHVVGAKITDFIQDGEHTSWKIFLLL